MRFSVTGRTCDISIRISIGAPHRDILCQSLLESKKLGFGVAAVMARLLLSRSADQVFL